MKRKYSVAVALLAVLAVVFGFAGTSAPMQKMISPQMSSNSVPPYFIIPPNFDSGWVNITDKCGHYFNITHDLNTTEVFVDIAGKQSLGESYGEHQRNLGGTGYTPGWSRTYGGTDDEWCFSMVQTGDGGYTLAGCTTSSGAGGADFWLVKTDSAGNEQWSQTYGGTDNDYGQCVVQTGDGGYALAGYTDSFGAGWTDFWLVKTDSDGNMQWSRTYGGIYDDRCYSMVQTGDGGYALAGYTDSFGASSDFWLVKTDSDGNMQWSRTYGGIRSDVAYSVIQTGDGGYALAGYHTKLFDIEEYWYFFLVKADATGNQQWNQKYGTPADAKPAEARCVVQTNDGGYALAGYYTGLGAGWPTYVWLVRTDSDGNEKWAREYRPTFPWEANEVYSVVQTGDGGFAMAGTRGDFWLIRTDSDGNMEWSRTFGGTWFDIAYSVVQTGDGGYALAGRTTFGAGGYDFWFVKTGVEMGLAWMDSTANTTTLYRGRTDPYWNFVRVRIWTIEEPTWQFGDINQDGVVDVEDLFILSQNYGKTFSILSLTGIIAIAGIHTYKKRKQPT